MVGDDGISVGTLNPGKERLFGVQDSEPKARHMVRTEETVVVACSTPFAEAFEVFDTTCCLDQSLE